MPNVNLSLNRRTPRRLVEAKPEDAFTISFDGRELTAISGQTIAAVLWQAGISSWRRTRGDGRPRGVFCGIGACFDCLVTVDGERDVRACRRPAFDGAVVFTQDRA